jgi:hypothetical protein
LGSVAFLAVGWWASAQIKPVTALARGKMEFFHLIFQHPFVSTALIIALFYLASKAKR